MDGIKWFMLALGVGLAIGCDMTGPADCDICTTSAIVYGTVRSPDGSPQSTARITIEARAPSCRASGLGGNNLPIAHDSVRVDLVVPPVA
jgi:hypothetical protein